MFFFFQAEDGIRDVAVTGVQTCALPISRLPRAPAVGLRRADGHDLDRGRSKRDDRPASPVSLTECWQAPSRSLPSSRSATARRTTGGTSPSSKKSAPHSRDSPTREPFLTAAGGIPSRGAIALRGGSTPTTPPPGAKPCT